MKDIEEVYEIIEKENIVYEERNLKELGVKGIYIGLTGIYPVIAIDTSILNYRSTYISILSEELGHHFTTYGNLLEPNKCYMDKLIKNKKENIVREWAANYLITDDEFIQALLSCIVNHYEMCDYFNVTYDLLNHKIKLILKDEEKYLKIKSIFSNHEIQYNGCNI